MNMAPTIDVDNILKALGQFKRYTILRILYIYLVVVYLMGFPLLVYVTIGYTPDHKCKPLDKDLFIYGVVDAPNITYSVLAEEKCHTTVAYNLSTSNFTHIIDVPCFEGYEFDTPADTFVSEWNLVCKKSGLGELTQTIFTAGQAFGALLFPSLSDRFGRKPVLLSAQILLMSVSVVGMFSNYVAYAVLRFLTGAFQQGVVLTCSTFLIELVPKENRGTVSALGSFSWSINVMVIAGVCYALRNVSWRYIQLASGIHGVHSLAAIWFVDESVRWLIANNKMDEAKASIKKMAKTNKVDYVDIQPLLEPEEEMASVNREPDIIEDVTKNKNRETTMTVLKSRRLLKTILVMSFAWFTNALVYFGLIFTSTTLAGDRYLNFFINVAVEMPAMIIFILLVKRLQRRHLSFFFHFVAGISLIASVILQTQKATTASSVLSFIGKFGITGSFSVLFLFTPELYPTNVRNIGIGLGSTAARVSGMLAPYATRLATYVEWGPGIIFGVCCLISAGFMLLLPETSGKELPQTVKELEEWDNKNEKDKNDCI